MTTLAAAQQYATALSLPVFPLRAGGKAPATEHGFKDATRDVEAIERWFRERPTLNLGAPVPKGYVVVDVGGPEARRGALWVRVTPGGAHAAACRAVGRVRERTDPMLGSASDPSEHA